MGTIFKTLLVLAAVCLLAPLFAAEKTNTEAWIKTYDEKTIYYQEGYIFVPDRIVLNGAAYNVGGADMYRILSSYPSSSGEIENFRMTSVFGAGLLGGGALVIFAGLFAPRFITSDKQAAGTITTIGVVLGIVMGGAGIWLMSSDIKQNFLYRAIWYYNESALFEDPNNRQARSDVRFDLFSFQREF